MKKTLILAILIAAIVGAAQADNTTVEVDQLACLPVADNNVVLAQVRNDVPGSSVRLFFRRTNDEVEDFYFVDMEARGDGVYAGVFPRPEDVQLRQHDLEEADAATQERWALWWRAKEVAEDRDPNDDLDAERIQERAAVGRQEPRSWLDEYDDQELQEWLENLEYEPSEYYSAVYDAVGNLLAKSDLRVTVVTDQCPTSLTPQELGVAQNLTIGETAGWQQGEGVFHWLCEGVVTRIDPNGIRRADGACRRCIVAWYARSSFLIPLGLVTTGIIVVSDDDEPPASPSTP